jgi:hypothetical protein
MNRLKLPEARDEFFALINSCQVVGHEQAAKGQLEQAIWLWFHQANQAVVVNLTSIHTLSIAAQGVLAEVARASKKKPSILMGEMSKKKGVPASIFSVLSDERHMP